MIPTDNLSYDDIRSSFRWNIPDPFNIAEAICDRHARRTPHKLALKVVSENHEPTSYSFLDLKRLSDNAAAGLLTHGISPGDRVGISLVQGMPYLVSLLACFKIGALAVPISLIFGEEGIRYRLEDCGAAAWITSPSGLDKFLGSPLPTTLERIYLTGENRPGVLPFKSLLQLPEQSFQPQPTSKDDPALIFYTSGSTGPTKGVLHAQRVAAAHVPGFQIMFDLAPQPGDTFWTPSDWSWLGSLGDVIFPALYLGAPVVATPGRFSLESTYRTIADHGVTCPFLATAVLRRMRGAPPPEGVRFNVRAIGTGGEPMTPEIHQNAKEIFDASINDDYGLTEANEMVIGSEKLFHTPQGAIGKVVPGRTVAILDQNGVELPPGELGQIAMAADDPITMLGYWDKPEKTAEKIVNGWVLSGDYGYFDEAGFMYFRGRIDDVIRTSGLLVGPDEVEAQLLTHPDVFDVGVVGLPDPVRGQIVAAFIQLKNGEIPHNGLAAELQTYVKTRLSAHAYPRRIEFVPQLPMTSSGKVQRSKLGEMYA